MKGSDPKNVKELIGIVISGMPRSSPTAVFSAYVWAPAPPVPDDPENKTAA